MRRIDGGDRFLEMMISMSAKQAEATERDSTDQD